MRDFDYAAPTTLEAAIALLREHGETARPLAGGTDLIDHLRTGRLVADHVVDLKSIPELQVLELSDAGLRVGAAVPCCRLHSSAEIRRRYTALADSTRIIGGVQIQNRASVGGNLCNSGPAADSTPALIALSAVCVIDGVNGRREVPVEEFCTGPGKNVLQPGEILVELRFPPRAATGEGSHYRRFIPRNEMDIAVVGVGAAVKLDDAGTTFQAVRVALGAVAATPLFVKEIGDALAGEAVGDAAFAKAAELARNAATPIDDMRGTIEFRKHIAGVLTERVLRTAVSRATGGAESVGMGLPIHNGHH